MKINEYIKQAEKKHDIRIIYITVYGSKLYGTDTGKSDTDYKGIFIPNKRQLMLKQDLDVLTYSTSSDTKSNTDEDVDIQLFSIHRFFSLMKKGETGAIDLYFSMFRDDTICHQDIEIIRGLREMKKIFLHKKISAFIGYANGMAKKYQIRGGRYNNLKDFTKQLRKKYPPATYTVIAEARENILSILKQGNYEFIRYVRGTGANNSELEYLEVLGKKYAGFHSIEYLITKCTDALDVYGTRVRENENGADYKGLSHSLRVLHECYELLDTGHISFPLKSADILRNIKEGAIPIHLIKTFLEESLVICDKAMVETKLPEEPQSGVMDQYLLDTLQYFYKEEEL